MKAAQTARTCGGNQLQLVAVRQRQRVAKAVTEAAHCAETCSFACEGANGCS